MVDEAFQAALAKAAASGRARQEITLDNLAGDLPVVPCASAMRGWFWKNVLQKRHRSVGWRRKHHGSGPAE
jgi:hypothetical protein